MTTPQDEIAALRRALTNIAENCEGWAKHLTGIGDDERNSYKIIATAARRGLKTPRASKITQTKLP